MCTKFQQKILNFVVVGARRSFQFLRQIAWFLGNNRALSKLSYQILYNLISTTKLWKDHSIKDNFNLTTRATLSKAKRDVVAATRLRAANVSDILSEVYVFQ